MMNSILNDLKRGFFAPEIKEYWLSLRMVDETISSEEHLFDEEISPFLTQSTSLSVRVFDPGIGEIWTEVMRRTPISLTQCEDRFFLHDQGSNSRWFNSQEEFVRALKLRSFE